MTHLTKSLSGSKRFDLCATSDIAVLSPPGMMSASQEFNSASLRTSMKDHFMDGEARIWEAERRSWMCSLKAPWRARTPIVIEEERPLIAIGSRCMEVKVI